MMYPLLKHWQSSSPLTSDAERELQRFPSLFRQILYNRGFSTEQTAMRFIAAQMPEGSEPKNLTGS
jgi:hypothetical protein